MKKIVVEPLTQESFAPFGDVLDCAGVPDKLINQDLCERYHNRASLDFSDGKAGISMFNAQPRSLPYLLDLMERHPEGSQAFIPLSQEPFLVSVAHDNDGKPDKPKAFLTAPGQAINFHRNVWHGVLTPLSSPGIFAVIDRIGTGANLQEFWFDKAYEIIAS